MSFRHHTPPPTQVHSRRSGVLWALLLIALLSAWPGDRSVLAGVTLEKPDPSESASKDRPAIAAGASAQQAEGTSRPVRRVGLFVGVGQYADPGIRDLRAARRDAQRMSQVMQEHGNLDQVIVLLDQAATLRNVERAIRETLPESTRPGDEVFLFWSGHGGRIADTTGRQQDGCSTYLVPHDAKVGDRDNIPGTVVMDDQLARWLDCLEDRTVVLIIDTPYAGGMANSKVDVLHPKRRGEGHTGRAETAMLGAAAADQAAFERRDGDLSAMTYYLIQEIEQATGGLTVEAAHEHLRREVPAYIEKQFPGQTQTPVLADTTTRPVYLRPARRSSLRVQAAPEIYVFYSTMRGQLSWECSELQQGVFSHFLIEGLQGKADADGDGRVSLLELGRFAQKDTHAYSLKRFNRLQKPQLVRVDRPGTADVLSILDFELTSVKAVPERPLSGNRRALLIGVNEYEHLADLKFAEADAQGLARQLVAGGFPEQNVTVLHDGAENPEDRPLKARIQAHLDRVLGTVEPGDLLVIAFSGHAATFGDTLYLASRDAAWKDRAPVERTWTSVAALCRQIELVCNGPRVLLLIDANRTEIPLPARTR